MDSWRRRLLILPCHFGLLSGTKPDRTKLRSFWPSRHRAWQIQWSKTLSDLSLTMWQMWHDKPHLYHWWCEARLKNLKKQRHFGHQQMLKRLASWKSKVLATARRKTLISTTRGTALATRCTACTTMACQRAPLLLGMETRPWISITSCPVSHLSEKANNHNPTRKKTT